MWLFHYYFSDPNTRSGADILGLLRKAGSCYATAVRVSPKDPRGHIGMGVVMEEMFYVQDMYGVKDEEVSRHIHVHVWGEG